MARICDIQTARTEGILQESSCAFGVFDGVHRGHRFLIDSAIETSRLDAKPAVIITFDIDPDELFHAERLKKLMSNEERLAYLASFDVEAVCVLPFTRSFASANPREFLDATFGEHIPAHLHIGSDFRFGARASGTVDDLVSWSKSNGMQVHAHNLVSQDNEPITSTRIRLLLAAGNIEQANELLGHPFTLSDVIRPGRGEGADFGFATANMEIPVNKQVLGEGVYAAYALIDGKRYRAAVNVGISPLFEESTTSNVEVHVLDFSGDLYGQRISVEFIHYLRPVIEFESVDELIKTVKDNIEWVRSNLMLDDER